MDAVVHLVDTSELTVKVRQPGSSSFTDLNGYSPKKVETGELLSDVINSIPSSELPAVKTVNGISYELKWYSDENLSQPLDLTDPVDSDRTIYAAYIQEFTVRYFVKPAGGGWPNTPTLTVKVAAGDPLPSLENPSSINPAEIKSMKLLSYWYTDSSMNTRFNFSGTVNSNIDLYGEMVNSLTVTIAKRTNPAGLAGPYQIHCYGGNSDSASLKAPIRADRNAISQGLAVEPALNEINMSLSDGQSCKILVPVGGKLRVTEDNPDGYIQYYRWGNYIGNLINLDVNPLEVTKSQFLTIFNSQQNPPGQTAYFYGQIQNGSGSTLSYGLGQGFVSGPLVLPPDLAQTGVDFNDGSGKVSIGNNIQKYVKSITRPSVYPDLEIDGKTYRYGYPTPGTAGDYYTLNWKDPVTVETSIAPGVNNMFTPSQTRNYRQNADIVLHPYTSFTLASENVNGTGDADPDYEVTYIVQFQPNGSTDPIIAPTGTNIIKDNDNQYKIKLKSGQNVSFSVPVGIKISVIDDVDQKFYTPSWALNGSDKFTQDRIAHSVPIPNATTITFKNTRNLIVPTDYERPDILPYLLMSGLLVGLFILMNRRKKA